VRAFAAAPTEAAAKNAEEWGEKYSDECFAFEKEWEIISKKIDNEQRVYLEKELSEMQRRKVEMLADKLLDMNIYELRYFAAITKDKVQKTSGINPMKMNLDWPSVKRDDTGSWPPANPNWFKQQEMMARMGPMLGMMGGGGAPAAAAAAPVEAKVEKPKEEEKKEKSHYDIELTKFDAAKKIALIKEVRGILNLGLKEAKEMVEGSPVWLKKEVAKEEAEKLVAKLKEFGAECRLA
jgi:large subunit ribosomal protein L7/L12